MTDQHRGMCPCCGYNLTAEKPIEDGPYRYDPRQGFFVDGVRLEAAPRIHELLGTLMRLKGRFVSRDALAERMGCEGDSSRNNVSVQLTHARHAFRAIGRPMPTETKYGVGVRWKRADAER